MKLTRRLFLASSGAAAGAKSLPRLAAPKAKRVLTLVVDKATGTLKAVDRLR